MKISKVIEELESLRSLHGEVEVLFQESEPKPIHSTENFFMVAETYEGDDSPVVNLRSWPY